MEAETVEDVAADYSVITKIHGCLVWEIKFSAVSIIKPDHNDVYGRLALAKLLSSLIYGLLAFGIKDSLF